MSSGTVSSGGGVATDLFDEVMFRNPHPHYRELRERRPVSAARTTSLGPKGTLLLTRYDDVMTLHTDGRFSSQPERMSPLRERLLPRFAQLLLDSMVFKDEPDHTRLRRLVNRAFTPKMVAGHAGRHRVGARLVARRHRRQVRSR